MGTGTGKWDRKDPNNLKFVRSLQPGISIMFRSLLRMKTLDWSVETLGLDYNSTGICNHLFKPE
jgi:hypothetical protein